MNSEHNIARTERILITGSSGFIGVKVVEILLEYGFRNLRCLVRPSSKRARLNEALARSDAANEVEIVTGDLLSRHDCRRVAADVAVTCHLAAGIEKSFAGAFMNSALATRNLLDSLRENAVTRRFVNVSSFAVYSNLGMRRGALLDETCPLENASQERLDPYGFGKLKQDEVVIEYGEKYNLPYVILRPGMVYGPGRSTLSGRVGIDTFGIFLHLGGSNRLPMTFVDNCADAIVLAALKPGIEGEIFNVVDDEALTSRQFLRAYKRQVPGFFSMPVPYVAAHAVCALWERYSKWSRGQLPPVFNRRRCSAEWKGNRFSNRRLREKLGWAPRVPLDKAMAAFLSQFRQPLSP